MAYTRLHKTAHLHIAIAELDALCLSNSHQLNIRPFFSFLKDPIYKKSLKLIFEASGAFCLL
jgi:hypothetical protein